MAEKVNYFLNNIPFSNYNVSVSDSSNLYDRPSFKEGFRQSWDDEHGYDTDLNKRYAEAKTITLDCFIKAANLNQLIQRYNTFLNVLDAPKSKRLSVVCNDLRAEYQVFRIDSTDTKIHYDDTKKVGVFKLKLVENMPIKRILKSTNQNTTITISSPKILVINWGDGTEQYTQPGQHTYTKNYFSSVGVEFYPIILGDIDSITSFNTNATVIWSKF